MPVLAALARSIDGTLLRTQTRERPPRLGAGAWSDSDSVRAAGVLPPGHREPRSSWFGAPRVRSSGPSRRHRR